ncbi:glycosyltransferase [Ferruginibacter paludis]|uniref:glycosyltransferase n=1 Tax=Ferruginibacter paludis TaxID=1310417 RepID=UPI0025B5F3A5|nr:glycosyltransferase [Ferruginibacter paludis]MDN3655837.1 glycosyltransferase [Ferruginibacter paludis]
MNDRLIDRYLWRFCDGVIAISNYLVEHLTLLSPLTPVIKIPVNSDYAKIAELAASKEKNYLMYCGTIYYEEVIEFIISLFVLLKSNGVYEGALLLIVSGDHSENQDKLDEFLKNVSFRKDIIIKSDIPETELFGYYKSADVLLIPLRDTVQDIARFPHKIGEYTAAGRPLLSTNVGELKNYFTDGVSAILADAYSVESYYHKILPFISSRQKLDQIGREGQAIGKSNFDFRGQGEKLKAFIDSLPAV